MIFKKSIRPRILVVDDNAAIHEDFKKILIKTGHTDRRLQALEVSLFGTSPQVEFDPGFQVDCALQGQDGLEMLRQGAADGKPYALAFVDGRMPPGWDGIVTIGHFWKEFPDLQVVLCTAHADYSWMEIHRELGESDNMLILKKPFDNVEVLQMAHALSRKWELTRQVQERIENLDDIIHIRTEEKDRTTALFEAALVHSPAGIIISSEKETLKILWANQEARRICEPHHFLPPIHSGSSYKPECRILHPDDSEYQLTELPLVRAVGNGETIHDEEITIRKDGDPDTWISCNASPIYNNDGQITAGILVFQNISERRKSQIEHDKLQVQLSQIQKLESIGLLAGGIAHDFNNMLGVILGHTELGLLGMTSADPMHSTLKGIQTAAKRSAELTQQLLAFARRQTVTPLVLDLNENITSMISMLQRIIGEDIDLRWEPQISVWPIRLDPSQIDQILVNLCVNARDAIEGIGKMTIETCNVMMDEAHLGNHPEFKVGPYVMLAVSDSGHGMDKETCNHIFEPFFTTKDVGTGTGLGLATVYGIVKQNDGFIYVYSEVGKGSTFKIYFPRFAGETQHKMVESVEQHRAGQGETVLLVEDESEVLLVGRKMLSQLGYTVLTASSPPEALDQAEKHKDQIQLLITDVIMPGMNGRDLSDSLLSMCPNLKVLFISGYTSNAIGHRGLLDEGVHFIQKPFSLPDFAAKVKEALV